MRTRRRDDGKVWVCIEGLRDKTDGIEPDVRRKQQNKTKLKSREPGKTEYADSWAR